ncbi:MAG: hypothetical protein V5A14_01240 [Desulfohalobiaceae bacterium]
MPSEWSLTLEDTSDGSLRIVAEKGQQSCALSRPCADEKELNEEIRRLQGDLDRLAEKGRDRFAELREREKGDDPAQIWQEMEALVDEGEMMGYFNGLSKATRRQVAEYVMTRVSAFKGMSPRFTVRYNSETNFLE